MCCFFNTHKNGYVNYIVGYITSDCELFYIYTDTDGDGEPERYNLFNEQFEGYYWQYDNNGLKVAQLRFYQGISTQVK